MELPVLVASALVLPLAWGWVCHWLVARFWPRGGSIRRVPRNDPLPPPFDYQI